MNTDPELRRLRRDMVDNRKLLEDLMKRVDSGAKPRPKTIEKTARKTTKLLVRLLDALVKHRATFLLAFGVRYGAKHVLPEKYQLHAYLIVLAPFIGFVLKSLRSSIDYLVTYHMAIPLLLAFQLLVFAINALTSVGWRVLKFAIRAKKEVDENNIPS
jgi:hypothetical protein